MGCMCARKREKEDFSTADSTPAKLKQSDKHSPKSSGKRSAAKSNSHTGTIRIVYSPIMTLFQIEAIEITEEDDTVDVVRYLNTSELIILRKFPKPQSELLPEARQNFAEEGGLLCRFDHPNVARTFELLEDGADFGVVSEYAKGGFLLEKLKKHGRMTEPLAARLAAQILHALSYCHAKSVYHLRLSMTDFLLSDDSAPEMWVVKVAGWEKGRTFSSTAVHRTSPSCFLAPEVFAGKGSDRSDVWSCGVMLYALLTGKRPLTAVQYLQCLANSRPPEISFEGLPSTGIVSLLRTMLAWDPLDRPSAAQCVKIQWIEENAQKDLQTAPSIDKSIEMLAASQACSTLKKAVKQFIIENAVDQSDISELTQAFKAMDTNGDGLLSVDELTTGLKKIMPADQAKVEARRIMHLADANGNGLMDYSEFLSSSYNEAKLLSHDNLLAAFKRLDTTSSGTLRTSDLGEIFVHMKEREKKKLLRELMKAVGATNNISYRDFAELILKISA